MRRPTKIDDPTDEPLCYESALRFLAGRAHSKTQLTSKLTTKGFNPDVVDLVIRRLAHEGWISDEDFAQEFARSRVRRHQGRLRIQRDLEARGVPKEAVVQAVAAIEAEEPESERLERACAKKLESMLRRVGAEEMASEMSRKKLAAFLLKQGYEPSDIIDTVDRKLKDLKINAD